MVKEINGTRLKTYGSTLLARKGQFSVKHRAIPDAVEIPQDIYMALVNYAPLGLAYVTDKTCYFWQGMEVSVNSTLRGNRIVLSAEGRIREETDL